MAFRELTRHETIWTGFTQEEMEKGGKADAYQPRGQVRSPMVTSKGPRVLLLEASQLLGASLLSQKGSLTHDPKRQDCVTIGIVT